MKLLDLKEQLLNEINMSPNALRRAAAEIGAKAGMEFEMIVPGAAEADDDYDMEPDYDSDESVNSIQEAFDFFYDGDYNSRRDCERLRETMSDSYQDWLGEQVGDRWEADKVEMIYDWLRYNAAPSDVFGILGKEEDENGNFPDPEKKDYAEAADKVAEDQISPWYEEAEEDFRDNFYGTADMESEWLEHEGLSTMQDIESNYDIRWPHYYNSNTGGDVSIDDAADSFSRAIGREVQASQNYHSRSITRPSATELHYVVEPDGSLEADDDNDGGLEFVSPALPIDELLNDLKKVKAWADKTGCYTNDSTGLHINVSVPKWQGDLQNLDYVKLAILMGDEYVLENFGRSGNTYAKSALKIVKDNITQRPEDVKRLLDTMKEHLNTSAAKLIHSGSTSKYTSVNTKDGYIEFRSPGGDWLNSNFDKIETTLLRFVVAMDAAADETKYKEEYAKKLYKLLAGDQKDATNTMTYFAKYAAGELPQSALKSFIKQAQFERKLGKEPDGKKYWYRVDKEGRGQSGASIEVVATSKEEALDKAASEWSLKLSALAKAAVYPIRPYKDDEQSTNKSAQNKFELYRISDGRAVNAPNGTPIVFNATSPEDAIRQFRDRMRNESNPSTYSLISTDNQVVAQGGDVTDAAQGDRSFDIKVSMIPGSNFSGPVIDLDRTSLTTIDDVIDKQDSAATSGFNVPIVYSPETTAFGGTSLAKHITKEVILAEPATGIKVIVAANRPSVASFELYFRTGTSDDLLEGIPFILQTEDTNNAPDDEYGVYTDYEYLIGGLGGKLAPFTKFQLKIVMLSTNAAKVPTFKNLRVIALAD